VSEKAGAIGSAGDLNLVDFGFYLLGDRQAMSAAQSDDFKFSSDVTAFRVIERVDGRPWLLSAITPNNGGSTLSPFVQLV
jgi:HK97 family phage major capsid protein